MSHRYLPVAWNAAKWRYDAVLVAAVMAYLLAFMQLGPLLQDPSRPLDTLTLAMRAHGSCAFLLMTLALAIGPLARLDRRFLPLLYNRRHLGVVTFLVALSHALAVLGWHFAFSDRSALVAALSSEGWGAVPFIPFGILALLALFALAATSHDFWLGFLGPAAWKALHMSLYPAYAAAVAHVAFGHVQAATSAGFTLLAGACAVGLAGLHLLAARQPVAVLPVVAGPWLRATRPDDIADGRGLVVRLPDGDEAAIFRDGGRLAAVSNLCAHQNGPLGEGRVLDGCITCPWHGYQYRFEDGCAPPPFKERLRAYGLRLQDGWVWLDVRAHAPGQAPPPLVLAA